MLKQREQLTAGLLEDVSPFDAFDDDPSLWELPLLLRDFLLGSD